MLTISVWPRRLKEFLLTHPLYKSPCADKLLNEAVDRLPRLDRPDPAAGNRLETVVRPGDLAIDDSAFVAGVMNLFANLPRNSPFSVAVFSVVLTS